jgi:predicted ester cyclase
MSIEENKAVSRRYIEEIINTKNPTAIDEICSLDYIDHDPFPGILPNRDSLKQFPEMHFAAFPDYHSTIEDKVAEGDKVVLRFTSRGTHRGDFFGISPTGKQVTVKGIAVHRIANGKVVENWVTMDMLSVMQQLGVVPPPS